MVRIILPKQHDDLRRMALHLHSVDGMKACSLEQLNVFLLDESVLQEAARWVSGCSRCEANALVPLEYLFDVVTGADPTVTEYVMWRPLKCPSCSGEITEKTRVYLC